MHEFTHRHISVPSAFAETLGYTGSGRYVAFYWTPAGDELMYSDGQISGTGEYAPWLLWTRHITVAPALLGFDFGSSDAEAQHWLLLDQQRGAFYIGIADQVARFLHSQPMVRKVHAVWEALSPEEQQRLQTDAVEQLQQALQNLTMPSPEDLERQMKELRRRYRKLELWLDQQPVTCPACGYMAPAGAWNGLNHTCPSCGQFFWESLVVRRHD